MKRSKKGKAMIELPEPSAHMYPSDLEKFQTSETFAHAFSVKVSCPGESSTELYTADQLRTYGDQRAAEAREQMREECALLCAVVVGVKKQKMKLLI